MIGCRREQDQSCVSVNKVCSGFSLFLALTIAVYLPDIYSVSPILHSIAGVNAEPAAQAAIKIVGLPDLVKQGKREFERSEQFAKAGERIIDNCNIYESRKNNPGKWVFEVTKIDIITVPKA